MRLTLEKLRDLFVKAVAEVFFLRECGEDITEISAFSCRIQELIVKRESKRFWRKYGGCDAKITRH